MLKIPMLVNSDLKLVKVNPRFFIILIWNVSNCAMCYTVLWSIIKSTMIFKTLLHWCFNYHKILSY